MPVDCPPFEETAAKSDRTIVLIDPWSAAIGIWVRNEVEAWRHYAVGDLDATLETADLGIRIPVRDIYERVALEPIGGSPGVWLEVP